jgi:hypothetical protein
MGQALVDGGQFRVKSTELGILRYEIALFDEQGGQDPVLPGGRLNVGEERDLHVFDRYAGFRRSFAAYRKENRNQHR